MLRTLIRYECKKSIGNRFFLIVLCLFLLVQMVWIGGLQEWLEYQDYLEQMWVKKLRKEIPYKVNKKVLKSITL